MTENEKKALWAAIRDEQRPLINVVRKKAILLSAVAFIGILFVFICLGLRDVAFEYVYLLAMVCIFAVMIAVVGQPTPRSLGDEEFRNKALRISTVEKLRVSLGQYMLDDLLALKDANTDRCLHVNDILYLLEITYKESEESKIRSVAQKQQAALTA